MGVLVAVIVAIALIVYFTVTKSSVELLDERGHAIGDLIADHADTLDRLVLRVGNVPIDAAGAGRRDWTGLFAAGRDDDIRPGNRLVVEAARNVVGCVDADLLQRLEHHGVRGAAGLAARRPCFVSGVAIADDPFGDHRAARVRHADEQDPAHADSGAGCSPRTNW